MLDGRTIAQTKALIRSVAARLSALAAGELDQDASVFSDVEIIFGAFDIDQGKPPSLSFPSSGIDLTGMSPDERRSRLSKLTLMISVLDSNFHPPSAPDGYIEESFAQQIRHRPNEVAFTTLSHADVIIDA